MEPGPVPEESGNPIDISIILPAYQEEQGIAPLLDRIREVMDKLGRPWEVVVVDDGSTDGTAARAREAGSRVISHPYNIGNGAAVKTGIREARGRLIVMMDADGQHDPADIPRLLEQSGAHDMVVGARTKESETSLHRDLANKAYNWFASYICNRRIEDLTSGFRAIKADAARAFLYLLPNTYSYPTTLDSGHCAIRTEPEVRTRENSAACRPKQDHGLSGTAARFLLHHHEDRHPLFAHEGIPASEHDHVPHGTGLRPGPHILIRHPVRSNVRHADYHGRRRLHGRPRIGTGRTAAV